MVYEVGTRAVLTIVCKFFVIAGDSALERSEHHMPPPAHSAEHA